MQREDVAPLRRIRSAGPRGLGFYIEKERMDKVDRPERNIN